MRRAVVCRRISDILRKRVKKMYQFESRVRYSEVEEDGCLSLTGIMNYLQDCTLFHSEECGRGIEWLRSRDRAWLLSAWQIDIRRRPRFLERISVITRPYGFQGSLGYRWFEIQDGEGHTAVSANSIWCYVQTSSMRPVRVLPEDGDPFGVDEARPWQGSRKIRTDREGRREEAFTVRREHLDTNHHVNNGQYVSMAAVYLPRGFQIGQVCAEYKRQARLGDRVVPVVTEQDNRITVALGDGEKVTYAVVAFRQPDKGDFK